MEIDHIGYAVKNIKKAIPMFENLGYCFSNIIEDFDRNILIAFGEMHGYRIELIAPMKSGESPVDGYLKKNGATPYHICYKSCDFKSDLESLIKNGYKVIIEAKPTIAFSGKVVVFLWNPVVGLLELLEGEKHG